jgi:hypothetical protein
MHDFPMNPSFMFSDMASAMVLRFDFRISNSARKVAIRDAPSLTLSMASTAAA